MKNLFILALIPLFIACKQEQSPKDYAVIHGKIENPEKEINLRLYNPVSSESTLINVDENGVFRDTLKLKEPTYFTGVYENVFDLYLKNDMDVEVNFDAKNTNKSITFSGKGEAENKFLKYKGKQNSELVGEDYKKYLGLENSAFNAKTDAYVNDLLKKMDSQKETLDSSFIASEKEKIQEFKKSIQEQHEEQLIINENLASGKPSPQFTDYLNYKGGTSSLEDFKGKYVYIDVWATWCVPCIYEMPFMNKIEEEYEGRNIHFIGLSIDNPDHEKKWRKMIVDKELKGTQLLADNQIDSQFVKDYHIYGIPRFILLDPEGNIVTYDAPRPSQPRLKELFDSLDI
ncbi:TlpA family protein disulfide reductase [Marixanthomonas spongiae]|uniref:TlpA family protein disulfide reductase n=1 Tax=Marixanthomonas spongiae TaxID=2174845 RepID=A0A2U0HV47_9FLAO|nr:TlpA disulfide reductase family protein [Marixanthomonas spongiae]PVW12620.1 TlpA family protein disulfide reductase [Marixanthomonas spongiae]